VCLSNVGNYEMICQPKHLVGLLLCVFVKKHLCDSIKDVRTCSTGVGIMGVLGNKGGIGISMNIFDSSICFISAHLAAHTENVEGRNLDFKNIIERSVFLAENSSYDQDRDGSSSDQVLKSVLPLFLHFFFLYLPALCSYCTFTSYLPRPEAQLYF
jgi:hypothetical protein